MINSHFILPEDAIEEVLSFVVTIFQQTAADVHEIAYVLICYPGTHLVHTW
jgi:hypothetical protein